MQWKQSLLLLVPVSILLTGVSLTLTAFDLDTRVLAELMTLKDPVSESTSRFLPTGPIHSVRSAISLAGLRAGGICLGHSAIPRTRSSTWFMNADNQYVEILVNPESWGSCCSPDLDSC